MSENLNNGSQGQTPESENNPYTYPPQPAPQAPVQQAGSSGYQPVNENDVRSSASLAVILGIIGWLPPLIFWVVYKDKPGYQHVRANAAATFNFLLPVWLMSLVLSFIPFLGWIAILGIFVWQIIALVQGYSATKEGRVATYPFKISILS